MFGDAYDYIAEKAKNAYSTVQMSQNDYLQQANGFATGLKTALDGDAQAAAELADKILTAEADIVAATGNSQEAVQNAFNGIMKSNFTMLDNLQIGITPTKEGFQEVIDKVNEWNTANGKATKYQISNLADCQSALIDYISMQGLSGYAQAEASKTIQGSLSMTKAAWSNLLTGIADDSQDFDVLVNNLVDSVSIAAENLLPRAEIAIGGVGKLVEKLLPVVVNRLPKVINNILPKLIQSGSNMVSAVLTGLEENLPEIADGAMDIVDVLLDAFIALYPQLMDLGLQVIIALALGIAASLPELIPSIISLILTIVDVLLQNVVPLTVAALQLIQALAEGLIAALPVLIERLPEIVMGIVMALIEFAPQLLEAASVLITTLAEGLAANLPLLLEMIILLVSNIVMALIQNAPQLLSAGLEFIMVLANALITYAPELLAKVPELLTLLKNKFLELLGGFAEVGSAIVEGIWSGISDGWSWLIGKVKELANSLFGAAKDELDINSPSKKFEWLAQMCVAGWDKGAEGLMNTDAFAKNVNAQLSTLQMNTSGQRDGGSVAGYRNFYQTVNVNQPVSTPDEMARAMRLEMRYGLMKGVPVGA